MLTFPQNLHLQWESMDLRLESVRIGKSKSIEGKELVLDLYMGSENKTVQFTTLLPKKFKHCVKHEQKQNTVIWI